jgi:hypothetical protein
MVAAICASVAFLVFGAISIWLTRSLAWLPLVLILGGIAFPLILLPGNLDAVYPYAVEIEEAKGLHFYAPFKEIYVPIEEVKWVKWSWLWTGWVIRLKKRRQLLTGFIIHIAWGRGGRDLARAIEEELARAGRVAQPGPGK